MAGWLGVDAELSDLARKTLFFIGGPPRSGTTWTQQIADAHPAVSCRGEALLLKHIARPVEAAYVAYARALSQKNETMFREVGGYPVPDQDEADILTGTAVLLALRRQNVAPDVAAIGEKTPENVFFFPQLKRIFPGAKFVGVARDPRDVLASAWHFFVEPTGDDSHAERKTQFVDAALPQIDQGLRAMVDLARQFPEDCLILTYERLIEAPEEVMARLFRFLSVSEAPEILRHCLEITRFETVSGGRPAGVARNGAFLRRGAPGAWKDTLPPASEEATLKTLGWAYPRFGWTP